MQTFEITEEEKALVLAHRARKEARSARLGGLPQNPQKCPLTQSSTRHPMSAKGSIGANDPASGPLRGRIAPGHPLYWFERDVFTKIGNRLHQGEHAKIYKAGMKIQADNRDRVYHILTHMDVMWEECNPLLTDDMKIRYEKYKKKWGIGDDNMNPLYKEPGKENDESVYPKFPKKRPWTDRIKEEVEKYEPHPEDGF